MIENVIKRNGDIQPFDAQKLNGWGIWASNELGEYVDWTEAVLEVVSTAKPTMTTEELQNSLIDYCLAKPSFAYNRMAGRLYIALLYKQIYDNKIPTVKEVFAKLNNVGIVTDEFFTSYTDEDYEKLNELIDHSYDLNYAHYQIKQSMEKYSMKDRVDNIYYETPQFSMLRVAMRSCMNKGKGQKRIDRIKRHYYSHRQDITNVPTPYYTNSGTANNGYLSCCLHQSTDELGSLATGDHISYMMTAASAGIGSKIYTRASRDKVRGGLIEHQGRINYLRAQDAMINANMQNGRGGSETQFFDCVDMESLVIIPMKNPMTPVARQVRGLDYSFCFNQFFAKKAALNEDYYLFSFKDHPELFTEMTSKNPEDYEAIYQAAVDGKAKRIKIKARDLLKQALGQSVEVGQMYTLDLTATNIHTPFLEPISQSNLCLEICLVTKPYKHVTELYKDYYEEGDGEVAVCAIAGISVGKVSMNDEEAEEQIKEAAWVALDMIHTAIHETDYPFPQVKFTATQRMSAGVGIIDLAHDLARRGLKYDTPEGLAYIHKVSERHYWHLLNASLELSQEFGNAPWMHKTAWPDGWLPIDTYNKNVDKLVKPEYRYDWEEMRRRIIANGGHAFSVLVANMPAESSSIKTGTTNGVYPIRGVDLKKGNDQLSYDYVVPDSDSLDYQIVWDIDPVDMAKVYGVIQKFTDQTTSADIWYKIQGDAVLLSHDLLRVFFAFVEYGVKSRYYLNSLTGKDVDLSKVVNLLSSIDCQGCKL